VSSIIGLGTVRGVLTLLLALIVSGLVIGALGRLAIPGRNPMSIGMTILLGIVGSLAGGLLVRVLGLGDGAAFIASVLCAAGLVYAVSGRQRRGLLGARRSGGMLGAGRGGVLTGSRRRW
jgi:uncharacterized membrane protein YeaQ/YmgE (transglycosylase-associated protein family)